MVLASFLLALSTLRKCNLTENTNVLKDCGFVTVIVFAYHLSPRGLKKHSKIGVQDGSKPFQNALRYQVRVGRASGTGLAGFWTPKWPPKTGP